MVCGIHPMISDLKFAVTKKFDPENGEKVITESENAREVEKTVLYKIDAAKFAQGFQSATLRALTVFPFSRKDENDGSYQIDGRMSFFFASEQMALRTGSAQGELRLGKKEIETTAIDSDNGMINFKLSFPGQVTYGEIRQEADAVKKFDSRIGTEAQRIATALALDDNALLKVVYRWTQHREDQNGITVWSPSFEKVEKDKNITYIHSAHTAFKPFKSNGQKDDRFEDWFQALDYMTEEALKKDFDVAIIGCGAYGFPLAARLKEAGKQVIHMGGATQLLFGIRGNRWDAKEEYQALINDAWCRPAENEKPKSAGKVENQCYW
jgi:hypothetical protein